MTNLGYIQRYLGIELFYTSKGVYLHQNTYANQILQEFDMETCNPSHTLLNEELKFKKDMGTENTNATQYRSMVGKLVFLTNTRPDVAFAVHCAAKFMQTSQHTHLQAVKGILRYIQKIANYGLFYPRTNSQELHRYSDADWRRLHF